LSNKILSYFIKKECLALLPAKPMENWPNLIRTRKWKDREAFPR